MEIAEAWGYTGQRRCFAGRRRSCRNTLTIRETCATRALSLRTMRNRAPFIRNFSSGVVSRGSMTTFAWDRPIFGSTSDQLDEFASAVCRKCLRLMHLANHHRRRISHQTWQAIRKAMQDREPTQPDAESIGSFLGLMSRPGRLASLLRRLHELRVIEQLIPEFKRTRGLLQFNAYHKYTVDAHSIRAVEAATNLQDDPSPDGPTLPSAEGQNVAASGIADPRYRQRL